MKRARKPIDGRTHRSYTLTGKSRLDDYRFDGDYLITGKVLLTNNIVRHHYATMFANASKTARSGTPEYQTPRVLVERMVAELVSSQRWSWITFETTPMKHFVEVAYDGGDELEISVAYGFSEDYQSLFTRQDVTIPDGWRVTKFKQKGWLGGGTMLLATGVRDIDRIAGFIDRVFPALYGEAQDYQLSGVYQS